MNITEKYYTVPQLAKILNRNINTIRYQMRTGKIKYEEFGGWTKLIPAQEVIRLLDAKVGVKSRVESVEGLMA